MINAVLIFTLLNTFCFNPNDRIELNFMLEISNNVDEFFTSQQICFYKEGKKIAEDEFKYYPFKLSLNSKCLKYYQMSDSVEFRFLGIGIFDQQYEYRIGFDKSFNLIDTANNNYYILSIRDIVNKGRNKKIINNIGYPYIFSIEKDNSYKHEIYSNWSMYDEIKIKNYPKMSKQSKLDYSDYRRRFWIKK